MIRRTVAVAGVAALALVAGCKGSANDDDRPFREDAGLIVCDLVIDGPRRSVDATVEITNNGDEQADYVVVGTFKDQDEHSAGDLVAEADDLKPGVTVRQRFELERRNDSLSRATSGACEITGVSREKDTLKHGGTGYTKKPTAKPGGSGAKSSGSRSGSKSSSSGKRK